MPTQSTTYNTRVTDEALEKRFRDTFRSQGGAELVDDLYASGVIIPVVDFTNAAEGSQLPQNLQTAWDFSTGFDQVAGGTTTLISNSGFWQVDLVAVAEQDGTGVREQAQLDISDGLTTKKVWGFPRTLSGSITSVIVSAVESRFVVFLRSGDSLTATSATNSAVVDVWYRQIATVSGDLVNPVGFTSS